MPVHTAKFAFLIICDPQDADQLISLLAFLHEFSAKIVRIVKG